MSGNQQPEGQPNLFSTLGVKTATTSSANNNQSGGFGAFSSTPPFFANASQNNATNSSEAKPVPQNSFGSGFGTTQNSSGGAPQSGTSGGSIFGSTPSGGQTNNIFGSNTAPSGGGLGFSGTSSSTSTNNTTSASNPLFGRATNPPTTPSASSNSLFGGATNQNAIPSTFTNPLFGGSTTPNAAPTSGPFASQPSGGGSSVKPSSNMFDNPTATAPSNTPSGGLFGGASGGSTSAPAVSLGIFGASTTATGSNSSNNNPVGTSLFGTAPHKTTPSSPFGAFGAKPPTPSAQPDSTTSSSTGSAPTAPLLFGNVSNTNNPLITSGNTTPSITSTGAPSVFSSLPKKPETAGATSSTPSTFSGFPNPAVPKDSNKEAGQNEKPASGSLFTRLGGASDVAKDQPKDNTTTKDAPSASPFSTFSLGGLKDAGTSKPSAPSAPASATPTVAPSPATQPAGTSVPAPSMLRGKTVEDIVSRWTTELETHTREFSQFASEVAVWDRTLIENGNYISALYATVLAAESTQTSLDQSLDHVEQQQRHLTATLDQYEKSASEILHGPGGIMTSTEGLGLADSERDKSYALAANLYTQLDELSRSLTSMVEAVNGLNLSSGPSQGSATTGDDGQEDTISTIAGILNAHLSSLQWIDGSLKDMDSKVKDAERKIKDAGPRGGARNGPSDGTSKGRRFGLGSS
ncbi:hypothetical protein K439DRAFT_1625972 [Ramaria rubella]|nr:hypothetical protein K439DRAFT_1625972 [Ramaria rubella]